MRAWVGRSLLGAACALGCGPAPAAAPRTRDNPLYISPDTLDFHANPRLRTVIAQRDYNYFRFTNRAFAREVCRRFAPELSTLAEVNLHGDAHLEQYAVTDKGRGLSDFDFSTVGPPVIDLVRFGTSIHLAAAHRGWQTSSELAYTAFMQAYLDALRHPTRTPVPPDLVMRARAQFKKTTVESLEAAEAWMIPVTVKGKRTQEELNRYAESVVKKRPELTLDYFKIKKWGRLKSGIGSGLDEKYLFTLEGPSDARADDVVVEAKLVTLLQDVPCVQSSPEGAPVRILVGQSRIAYEPYQLGGWIVRLTEETGERRAFWLHEWAKHYVELSIDTSLLSPEDLLQVARDVGYQLGRGHTRGIADPNEPELREHIASDVESIGDKLRQETRAMADLTISAARRYRQALQQQ